MKSIEYEQHRPTTKPLTNTVSGTTLHQVTIGGLIMSYVKTTNLTPSQAKLLSHMGFILKLAELGYKTDRYHIYVVIV